MTLNLVLALAVGLLAAPAVPQTADCGTWQECRQQALQAAERQDFEAFHDLAWRAVRKGPAKATELMAMLARAQSLSGRPLDAMVMLERLLALGATTEAATSDDFRRVRALPGWADFEKRAAESTAPPLVSAKPEPAPSAVPAPTVTAPPLTPPEPSPAVAAREPVRRGRTPARSKGSAAIAEPVPAEVAPEAALSGDAAEALRFTTLAFTPAGLAYDRVSNRFIVGDFDARKLTVVDEASQRVANLAGAVSAGFGSIAALEIDPREGDLWVISSPLPAAAQAAGEGTTTTAAMLHKLQLISGRVLYAVALDASFGDARFSDVAVTPHGSVLVLDAAGSRVFVTPAKGRRLDLALKLDPAGPTSLAPETDSVVYVAHAAGVLRADLGTRQTRSLSAPKAVSLAGLTRLRWHRGALLGVQASADGTYRIVRLRLDAAGSRVTSLDVLDRSLRMPDPTAASLAGDTLYYLAATGVATPGSSAETSIRRVTVK